jgi:predicted pyridoxine 5'-phosphate oxidase superfamily flavin-nucleotide-binding protein/tRNA A37 methylthiotransferase MiaB
MQVSLATSLHLDHGSMTLDHEPGDPPPMQSFVPAGLLSLKAYSDANGVPADIRVTELNGLVNAGFIANDDRFYEHLADAVLQPGDDFLGLMTDADSLHHTLALARVVKARSPETLVCLGGPASSPISRLILERFPCVDLVVRGEGEVTLAELLARLAARVQPADVLGLTWRGPEGVVENAERPVIADLDTLPIPAFDAHGMQPDAALYLDVGRGCPFKCHFCATAPFWKRRFRMKSIDRIVEEMRLLRTRYNRRTVGFSHDIFTADRRWTAQFCERMEREKLDITWACSTRTDIIDAELLERMARAGCVEIYFGIETGSEDMQHAIRKDLDLERCREIVAATAAAGIRPVTGLIVGYPNETRKSFNDTLSRFFQLLETGGHRAHLFALCPFHEAPMHAENHPIERRAAYFEMPLTPGAAAVVDELREVHPYVFSSLCRFATPGLDSALVDASEEISARLVVLKAVWPHLLPHYPSPLDWYEGWVGWIRRRNAEQRPGAALPCHGEIDDMLDFLEEEVARLGLEDSVLTSLLGYERQKLDASRRLRHAEVPGLDVRAAEVELSLDTVVAAACEYLIGYFPHDLVALLAEGVSRPAGERAVVFAKVEGDDLMTLQVSRRTARILERARKPRRIGDLVGEDGAEAGGPEESLAIVRALVQRGLVVLVDRRARDEGGTMPGSRGEHELQERRRTVGRAYAFYNNQMLDHVNWAMRDFIARQAMFFIGSADRHGNCDCSIRSGPQGLMRVLDERTLAYPEYRGNGVMSSLGNLVENPHVGVFFADFFLSTIGLHVNGRAELVEHDDLVAELAGREDLLPGVVAERERQVELWVKVHVEEAYIHCSKHIPLLRQLDKAVRWGTDDMDYKGGDYFQLRRRAQRGARPTKRLGPGGPVTPPAREPAGEPGQ